MNKATTQVKFTIESDIVSAFKARCASEGISMTSVVRGWFSTRHPTRNTSVNTATRYHRRKSVQDMIVLLSIIMDSESEYRDSIPEQFTQRYDAADHACDMLAEAIGSLEDAF